MKPNGADFVRAVFYFIFLNLCYLVRQIEQEEVVTLEEQFGVCGEPINCTCILWVHVAGAYRVFLKVCFTLPYLPENIGQAMVVTDTLKQHPMVRAVVIGDRAGIHGAIEHDSQRVLQLEVSLRPKELKTCFANGLTVISVERIPPPH